MGEKLSTLFVLLIKAQTKKKDSRGEKKSDFFEGRMLGAKLLKRDVNAETWKNFYFLFLSIEGRKVLFSRKNVKTVACNLSKEFLCQTKCVMSFNRKFRFDAMFQLRLPAN